MKVSNMALRFQPSADIVDTTGASSARNGFMGRGENITDSSKSGNSSIAENNKSSDNQKSLSRNGQNEGAGQNENFQPSATDRAHFRAIRDSIQSAHGGKLSPEDLRSEIQKMFSGRISKRNTPITLNKPKSKASGGAAEFGVISDYPEYQKSAYIPSHQSGRGRVWILKSNGLLESIFVRTGLNDGRYTEINSSRLKPGDQIVLGATSDNSATSQQVQSPLTSQSQRPPGGGGFR
jgi:hypothetical protein